MKIKQYQKWELCASHTARRSFATNLYLKVQDPYEVMAFTGHKKLESFECYIKVPTKQRIERNRKFFD